MGQRVSVTNRKKRGAGRERVNEILDAAGALFLELGYEATTTRRIAKRVGISQTGLYVYFPTREAILEATCGRVFKRLENDLVATEAATAEPAELPRALMRAYLSFALSHPEEYQIAFMMPQPRVEKSLALPFEHQPPGMQAYLVFRDQVARMCAGGLLCSKDPDMLAQTIWMALHGCAALLIGRPHFPWSPQEAIIDTLLHILLEGVTRDGDQ